MDVSRRGGPGFLTSFMPRSNCEKPVKKALAPRSAVDNLRQRTGVFPQKGREDEAAIAAMALVASVLSRP